MEKITKIFSQEETHRILQKHLGHWYNIRDYGSYNGRLLAALLDGKDEAGNPHLTIGSAEGFVGMDKAVWDDFIEDLVKKNKIFEKDTDGSTNGSKSRKCRLFMSGGGRPNSFRTLNILRKNDIFRDFINNVLEKSGTNHIEKAWFVKYLDGEEHRLLYDDSEEKILKVKPGEMRYHLDDFPEKVVHRGILTLGKPEQGMKMMRFMRDRPANDRAYLPVPNGTVVVMSRRGAVTGGVLHGIKNAAGTIAFQWEATKMGNGKSERVEDGENPGEWLWGHFFPDNMEKYFGMDGSEDVTIIDSI